VKVYTRTGDDGSTRLADGSKVSKANARVGAYGDVDELNAAVGLLRAEEPPAAAREPLERVQNVLFQVGAFLADPGGRFALSAAIVDPGWLERWIDAMQADLPELHNFVLPAGARVAALAHAARTVCRRAERGVVALRDQDATVTGVVPFLNRLSDALFVLARWLNHASGSGDVPWHAHD
jgi:cob(I)alamin adenosyltransferase